MFKILLKKQMTELFRSYFYNAKKNKSRSSAGVIGVFALFVFLMVFCMGGMFTGLSIALCPPMVAAGVGWLYFCILSSLAVLMGVLGSVFATYSGLYMAKDNDQLLAMPIPVRYIIASRLTSIYLLDLMYVSVVMLPGIIVHWCFAGITFEDALGSILLLFLISVLVMVLTCLLGWVVAKIGQRTKNKSLVTVLAALAFIALYYFLYFRAQTLINELINNAVFFGDSIKDSAYALYMFGRTGEGDWLSMLVFLTATAVLAALTWVILKRTFMGIATSSGAVSKVRYREKAAHVKGIRAAMMGRELAKFLSSPNYILNCGLGLVMMAVAGIALLVKGGELSAILSDVFGQGKGFMTVIASGIAGMMFTTVPTTAPSVSLEGKQIWIAQSLPITPWQALRAKIDMNMALIAVPLTLYAAAVTAFSGDGIVISLLFLTLIVLYAAASALFGLFCNLNFPNLNWVNELVPIKQGGAVMMSVFAGMGVSVAVAALYFLASFVMSAEIYLAIWVVIMGTVCGILYRWIRTRGAEIFAGLS